MADVNRGNRPLSPHLSIYRPQMTSGSSIMVRISGLGVLGVALFVVWWLGRESSPTPSPSTTASAPATTPELPAAVAPGGGPALVVPGTAEEAAPPELTEEQKANTEYARQFSSSKPDGSPVPDRILAMGERFGPKVGGHYREALGRSYFDGMLNYYRANYASDVADVEPTSLPDITCPVLQFHGLADTALHSDGLNNTWDWLEKELTLVTIPGAGHFVQQDASKQVTETMHWWLQREH